MTGQVTVESAGSIWLIDETRQCYLRMPKSEMARLPGNWQEPQPGDPLYDLEWHPLTTWAISDDPVPVILEGGRIGSHDLDACPLLVITTGDGKKVLAPNAAVR